MCGLFQWNPSRSSSVADVCRCAEVWVMRRCTADAPPNTLWCCSPQKSVVSRCSPASAISRQPPVLQNHHKRPEPSLQPGLPPAPTRSAADIGTGRLRSCCSEQNTGRSVTALVLVLVVKSSAGRCRTMRLETVLKLLPCVVFLLRHAMHAQTGKNKLRVCVGVCARAVRWTDILLTHSLMMMMMMMTAVWQRKITIYKPYSFH